MQNIDAFSLGKVLKQQPNTRLPLYSDSSENDRHEYSYPSNNRRLLIHDIGASLLSTACWTSTVSNAVEAPSSTQYIDASQAKVTNKVYFDVRVSRQDGSFYVRDDLPETPENQVFYGKIVVGLFAQNAPTHVEKFLSYIPSSSDSLSEENPLPSYGRSQFPRIDQSTGLLWGGKIPSLQVAEYGGSSALQYYGRILPASLWLERDRDLRRISHNQKGLLTHANLDLTPEFAITTRRDGTELDGRYTVFGKILEDESSDQFLSLIQDLPTYEINRPTSTDGVVEDAASVIYNAQRQFFRNTAKSFGDSRLDKTYEGKFLRRVEVTQVGVLWSQHRGRKSYLSMRYSILHNIYSIA